MPRSVNKILPCLKRLAFLRSEFVAYWVSEHRGSFRSSRQPCLRDKGLSPPRDTAKMLQSLVPGSILSCTGSFLAKRKIGVILASGTLMSLCTILHVEDDPNDVLLLERAFRKANVATLLQVVSDGDEAVSYLSGENTYASRSRYPVPALVLLDLKLPRKSGLEVLAWMRGQPLLKRLPVVMLTSSRHPLDINRAYDLGANSYLVKPVGFDALVTMVKQLHEYWLSLNEKPSAATAASNLPAS
jgi:CheY-like chemotaxis protein